MKIFTAVLFALFFYALAFAGECPKEEFQKSLTDKGFRDESSIESACSQLAVFTKQKNDDCKDALVYEFRQYYAASLDQYNGRIGEMQINEKNAPKLSAALSKAGWKLISREGNYEVAELPGWPENRLKGVLSRRYEAFFHMRSREIREGFAEDGALVIPWDKLRERIIARELFLKKYPGFIENDHVRHDIEHYLKVYLRGMDNSKIFDLKTNRLKKPLQASYEKFISQNKRSEYYNLIREYYEYLRRNNFVLPGDYDEFLKKMGQ
jgi:hypothetical protein